MTDGGAGGKYFKCMYLEIIDKPRIQKAVCIEDATHDTFRPYSNKHVLQDETATHVGEKEDDHLVDTFQ